MLSLSKSSIRRLSYFLLALVAVLVFGVLRACSATGDAASPPVERGQKPVVLTTFTVLADIAQNVAGDHLQVQSLTKPGAEIHGYEPTPGDIKKVASADLILDHGLGLEGWFAQFMQDTQARHVQVSSGVTPIPIEGSQEPNPHAWMSPREVQGYTVILAEAFAELDPAHADDYRENARIYRQKLEEVHQRLLEGVAQIPVNQRVLVTCEGAFSYLARDAGLTEKYLWAVNSDGQIKPSQVKETVEFVRQKRVPAVFCESTISSSPMQQVVDETGTSFGGVLYVDSLSEAGGEIASYLDLMTHDIDLIITALKGGEKP